MKAAILILTITFGLSFQAFSSSDIFEAARKNQTEVLVEYLNTNGNIDTLNANGYSLLVLAAYYNSFETAKMLVEAGANLEVRDRSGNTALIAASFKGMGTLVELLLEKGANPNALNNRNANALLFAATFGHTEVAETLISYHINMDQADITGKTAYDYARAEGNPYLTHMLHTELHASR